MFAIFQRLFKPAKLKVQKGRVYRNANGDLVPIVDTLDWNDRRWMQGYSFKDNEGNTYAADGRFWISLGKPDRRDLVSEI